MFPRDSFKWNPIRKPPAKHAITCKRCGWVRFRFRKDCPRCSWHDARQFDTSTKVLLSTSKQTKPHEAA